MNISKFFSFISELFVKSGENNPDSAKYMLGVRSPAGLRHNVLSILFLFRADLQSWCVDRDIRECVIFPICVNLVFLSAVLHRWYAFIGLFYFTLEAEEARLEMFYIDFVTWKLDISLLVKG